MSIFAERRQDPVEAAENQALFRDVNEQLKTLNQAFESATRESEFICECANNDCMEHVVLTLLEYEAVRRMPTHFLVSPASRHVFLDLEHVAEEHDNYFVVEKAGEAGRTAMRLGTRAGPRVSGWYGAFTAIGPEGSDPQS